VKFHKVSVIVPVYNVEYSAAYSHGHTNSFAMRFSGVPVFRIADWGYKKKYYVFNCVPFWKVSRVYGSRNYRLPLPGMPIICKYKEIRGGVEGLSVRGSLVPVEGGSRMKESFYKSCRGARLEPWHGGAL
jgi:hypothetical protein